MCGVYGSQNKRSISRNHGQLGHFSERPPRHHHWQGTTHSGSDSIDELSENGLCGTPDQITSRIHEFKEVGAGRIYTQLLDLDDLEHIALIGETVIPAIQ